MGGEPVITFRDQEDAQPLLKAKKVAQSSETLQPKPQISLL